eukprot:CAMPEP_0194750092 /NCGR_PEP_ID=MMETSP0323_2-20130528/4131_1 /TAXON_ID=2866 ORGANISM="Crypthecodinium cohnii, Strain Seligo" /NCGR_SAMPLE_ID=MMETSP0323_2 /ASSEMBLY_ACC=CAM_ASM_000346 /LENGTH=127 /DNA_ID=CAMNT_0039665525 /DNA_START=207 /DNA_END=589 /DNA_ORIENTATION=+
MKLEIQQMYWQMALLTQRLWILVARRRGLMTYHAISMPVPAPLEEPEGAVDDWDPSEGDMPGMRIVVWSLSRRRSGTVAGSMCSSVVGHLQSVQVTIPAGACGIDATSVCSWISRAVVPEKRRQGGR